MGVIPHETILMTWPWGPFLVISQIGQLNLPRETIIIRSLNKDPLISDTSPQVGLFDQLTVASLFASVPAYGPNGIAQSFRPPVLSITSLIDSRRFG